MECGSRLGIFGGTFNPVHMGHLITAQCALESFELSRVLFVPCSKPPHKPDTGLLAAEHRLAMLTAALEGDPRFEVCDVELRRGGVSYAVDTVAELRGMYPGDELCFILGADMLAELSAWKDVYSLLSQCRFVTLSRPGSPLAGIEPGAMGLDPPWPERLLAETAPGKLIGISSSDIRHRIAEGLSVRYLVPDAVEMYIAEHGLYA